MDRLIVLFIFIIFASLTSCYEGINGIYENGIVYEIGDAGPAGGIISIINNDYTGDGWLYLETAPVDEVESSWTDGLDSCSSKNLNGYSDWSLPTSSELSLIYSNGISGFTSSDYWSSTEVNTDDAIIVHMISGVIGQSGKSSTRKVRAVRKF